MKALIMTAFPAQAECLLKCLGTYTLESLDNAAAQVGHVCGLDIYFVIARIRDVATKEVVAQEVLDDESQTESV